MSFSPAISRVRKTRISQLISKGKRLDGRELIEYREIKIERGVIGTAEGSAKVNIGKTEVTVGIKIGIEDPFPDTPEEGVLKVNAELVPLASPTFEPGPPDENAIELARVVDRGFRESKAIDLKKLCLVPGKHVLAVYVDIYVLNYDGNLIDASALAALSALLDTKVPKYSVKNGEIVRGEGWESLPITNHPIAITFAKLEDKLVVDPSLAEEEVMDARLTITVDDVGRICAMQKGGGGFLTIEQLLQAVEVARMKANELRKIVLGGG